MKKILWAITLVLFIVAALSACSSEEFPTGSYTHQSYTAVFGDDGSFTLLFGDEIVTEGTYSIEGDEITWVNDTWCDAENAGPATYRWQHEDGVLSYELIGEDLCEGRRDLHVVDWFGPK